AEAGPEAWELDRGSVCGARRFRGRRGRGCRGLRTRRGRLRIGSTGRGGAREQQQTADQRSRAREVKASDRHRILSVCLAERSGSIAEVEADRQAVCAAARRAAWAPPERGALESHAERGGARGGWGLTFTSPPAPRAWRPQTGTFRASRTNVRVRCRRTHSAPPG